MEQETRPKTADAAPIGGNDPAEDARGAELWLKRAVIGGFAALLCAALWYGYVVFAENAGSIALIPYALICLALLAGLNWALGRIREERLSRLFSYIVISIATVMLFSNVAFFCAYRYSPVWDADAVFQGAQNWAAGELTSVSTPTFDASVYFLYFPNNLGATAILSLVFRLFGTGDAYLSACLANALLFAGMLLSTAYCAREIGGERAGLLAISLLALTPPLWFCAAAFYTDFFSIAFPISALFFALRAARCRTKKGEIALYALAAILSAIGALIKITVLIAPIAIVLWMLISREWKRAAICAVLFAAFVGCACFALNRATYPSQLDPQEARALNTPAQHWIMMGLSEDGGYNPSDYNYTRSFGDPEERKAALNAEIGKRVREYGPAGFLNHALRKIGYMVNDGTLMLSDYYDDSPQGPEWLKELLLPGGEGYGGWKAVCGGVRLATLLLALAGAVRQLLSRKRGLSGAAFLTLVGLMLFLSAWETSKRYSINSLPIWILCAARAFCGGRIGGKQKVIY